MDRFEIWTEILTTAEEDYYTLSSEERMIYGLKSILDAVNGSGLIAYYEGNAGGHAEDAVDDLYTLGLDEIAAVIESANAMFPDGLPPEDYEERNACIYDWEGEYDDLFDEWTDEILEFASMLDAEIERLLTKE